MEINLKIDWSELDYFGHVNNVMFAKYIQAARVNFMERVGIMKTYEEKKIGFLVAATSVLYFKPLFYPGNITIKTLVKETKNTSFILEHDIFNSENDLCARGEDVIVYFDFNKNEKLLLNSGLLNLLKPE
jgi:acyl-CoA thioester hydrolase